MSSGRRLSASGDFSDAEISKMVTAFEKAMADELGVEQSAVVVDKYALTDTADGHNLELGFYVEVGDDSTVFDKLDNFSKGSTGDFTSKFQSALADAGVEVVVAGVSFTEPQQTTVYVVEEPTTAAPAAEDGGSNVGVIVAVVVVVVLVIAGVVYKFVLNKG